MNMQIDYTITQTQNYADKLVSAVYNNPNCYTNWLKTLRTLHRHRHSGSFHKEKAKSLIANNVRDAVNSLGQANDGVFTEIAANMATDMLYREALIMIKDRDFNAFKSFNTRECTHENKQRQQDEYFCSECGRRWEYET